MGAAPTKILIAEDNEPNRILLEHQLRQAGYATVCAVNGLEALQCIAREPVDLVLLDVMMPHLDGYATLRQLRAQNAFIQLPVIILTALSDSNSVIEALRLGANDYAVKPVEISLLLSRIATHLKIKSPKNQRVGQYALHKPLGEGAMAAVFAAQNVIDGTWVALKILPRAFTVQPHMVRRFIRESQLLAQISHPNVVRFHGSGQDGETFYLAMELVEGYTLRQIALHRPLAVDVVLEVARQLALGLNEVARHGIVHRDIKPANVLVEKINGTIKIADFGVARSSRFDENLTESGMAVGSLSYAAPEQLEGEPEMRSDMYSLGCTLYFLLTGQAAFPPNVSLAATLARKAKAPPKLSDAGLFVCSEAVQNLLQTMMQPKAKKRFSSFNHLVAAITEIQRAETVLSANTMLAALRPGPSTGSSS